MTAGPCYRDFLEDLGRSRPDVLVIDAGLATSMQTDGFRDAFPARYFNLGIAEQNAVGVASGLARRGYVPLVHSFANFLARRAHDQIAVSVAWPGCPVKLIAGSCGLFDGRLGFSHLGIDDLGAMAALPEIWVAEPGDLRQTRALLERMVAHPGPAYLRIRRHGAPARLRDDDGDPLAAAVLARAPAPALTLVACGAMLEDVLGAAVRLRAAGVAHDLIHVQALRPLDAAPILDSARRSGLVAVVENHCIAGGFGDAISRCIAPHGIPVVRMAIEESILPPGDPAFLLARCGLDAVSLAARIMALNPRAPAGQRA